MKNRLYLVAAAVAFLAGAGPMPGVAVALTSDTAAPDRSALVAGDFVTPLQARADSEPTSPEDNVDETDADSNFSDGMTSSGKDLDSDEGTEILAKRSPEPRKTQPATVKKPSDSVEEYVQKCTYRKGKWKCEPYKGCPKPQHKEGDRKTCTYQDGKWHCGRFKGCPRAKKLPDRYQKCVRINYGKWDCQFYTGDVCKEKIEFVRHQKCTSIDNGAFKCRTLTGPICGKNQKRVAWKKCVDNGKYPGKAWAWKCRWVLDRPLCPK